MMNDGYIRIPRSLLNNPLWLDLPPAYKEVFLVILNHVVFKKKMFDDHGHLIELQPGQYCGSYDEILALAGKYISRNEIERAIKKLFLYQFVSQEVRYKKSIITITHPETYELILKASETTSELNLSQTRVKLELEKNKENKDKKEKKIINLAQSTSSLRKADLIFFDFENSKFEGISQDDMKSWSEAYPSAKLGQELVKMKEWVLANPTKSKSKKLWRKFITSWLSKANDTAINREAYASNNQSNKTDRRTKNLEGENNNERYTGMF